MPDPSLVTVRGPLESLAAGFVTSLLEQGYQRQSALIQVHLFAELSVWLLDEGLASGQLDATAVERFLIVRRRTGAKRYVSEKAMHAILTYLRRQGIVSPPPALPAKERALARTTPLHSSPGRYRPSDALLAFLEAL